ncbi:MAG: methyltransferase [Thiotrichales bacterium]|nr:methyltransferase [Thiotrichales bacterium]
MSSGNSSETPVKQPRRRRPRRQRSTSSPATTAQGLSSGAVKTLSTPALEKIHAGALDVLERVGFAEAPDHTHDSLLAAGCKAGDDGRIRFPRSLVEDTIAATARSLVLPGQRPDCDIELEDARTYFSTGCGSVRVVDPGDKSVRQMYLDDVYDFARIVDQMPNIHMFHRCGTPTELDSTEEVDVNLCYACVKGTSKPVSTSWFDGENVRRTLQMLHIIAGGESNWRKRPFVSNVCTFVVPPLTFSPEACLGMEYAIRGGMPVQLTSAGLMGATAPVTVAGTLVQTMAEVLGGLVYAHAIASNPQVFLGTWPMVADLRTGAATTGSAEQALVSSGACQLARFYGIPNGTISGISDSKLPDAQSGLEKGIQHAYVGNSGGNVLFCAAGSLATGLGCSHAGLVIDNEIIGVALRTVEGFEVDDQTLAVEVIESVCAGGPGHYLGHEQTLDRMKTGYFYPAVSDRNSIKDWLENEAPTVLDNAEKRAREILDGERPTHISNSTDDAVRENINIKIPAERVQL